MKNNAPLYPGLKSARVLTAPELNAIRLSERRTVITPERLRPSHRGNFHNISASRPLE